MPILRDWTDSRTVDVLDAHAERFFARLLMKVCDFGRHPADPRLLNSKLFPLKRTVRDTDISRWLAACESAGLVRCYTDSQGRAMFQINKWIDRKKFKRTAACG